MYAFSKKVTEELVKFHEIEDSTDILNIEHVIGKLSELPKALESNLEDLGLGTLPRRWAIALIKSRTKHVRKDDARDLLIHFTDAMKTRMREASKYALALLLQNRLILCHSFFGEETITPQWKTIQRMLDTDNVLRYVCFTDTGKSVTVRYWEKEATDSFIQWLGLPRKEAFLFGGKYKIQSEIENYSVEFQLTEEEMAKWLQNHSEFERGEIELSKPISFLPVKGIIVGKRTYYTPDDFIQDYEADKKGILLYQKEYERLNKKPAPLFGRYFDDAFRVYSRYREEEITEVSKPPNYELLFANSVTIDFRASYLSALAKKWTAPL
jgi:hypothetical protein